MTYTAVCVAPDYVAETYGQSTVTVHVVASDVSRALDAARITAARTCDVEASAEDWHVSALFEGMQANLIGVR